MPEIIHGGGQRPLRGDVLPSAAVKRGSNTIGIDVVRRRVVLQNDACFVERENVLEAIPRSILGHFAMPFGVHQRVQLRLLIEQFEFQTESGPLAVLRSDGFGKMLAALMNVARVKPVGRAWLHETKGHAVRSHENIVLQVVMDEFVERFEAIDLLASAFAIEKPVAIGVLDFDVRYFVGRFDADDIVARHGFRVAHEKEADLIARIEDGFGLRMRNRSMVVPEER